MGNDQKTKCSSCKVIKSYNSKTLQFILHDYHTTQLQSFLTPQFEMLPTFMEFFLLVIPPNFYFLEISRNYASIIITIVSNITVLVSCNAIFFGYFMPMSHKARLIKFLSSKFASWKT